jgi:hypothetical protein
MFVAPSCGFASKADGILVWGFSGKIVSDVPRQISKLAGRCRF